METLKPSDMETPPRRPQAEILPPETAVDPVVAELKGIRGKLDNISHKVDAWASENGVDQAGADGKGGNPSRVIAATGMAALGFKIGAVIGAKVGFISGLLFGTHSIQKKSAAKSDDGHSWWKFLYVREAGIGAAVGGVTGALSGAMLGWVRGERIKNPRDFFVHPMKTASILVFGDKDHPAKEGAPVAEAEPARMNWQSRTQAAPEPNVTQR